jgi:Kef-type K+ transport system membrane component KefB
MAGVSFDLLIGMMVFLIAVWGSGRMFRMVALPAILGEFLAGVLLGPNFLDIVPYASNGRCDTIIFPNDDSGSSSSSVGRMLAGSVSGPPCKANLVWTPRWTMSDTTIVGDEMHTPDIWSFMGTVGVTLLIMESGMHINFEKVKQIGGQALIVAIVGTTAPLVLGMLLVGALFGQEAMYPDGFAAGCALAPTSVGISIKLLSDAKMLNSLAGQTTLTAAFIDDVFSLVLLVLLASLSEGQA